MNTITSGADKEYKRVIDFSKVPYKIRRVLIQPTSGKGSIRRWRRQYYESKICNLMFPCAKKV